MVIRSRSRSTRREVPISTVSSCALPTTGDGAHHCSRVQVGEELVGADEVKLKDRLKEVIQQKPGMS